ncbi:MAG: hypothetical protein SV760_03995 [Halobacteria archaeon]|nr:hypothetical protein [Halobacteria archaeon]
MNTLEKEGRWELEKVTDGVYKISENGVARVEVVTSDGSSYLSDHGSDTDRSRETRSQKIKVRDDEEAKEVFCEYANEVGGGGFCPF